MLKAAKKSLQVRRLEKQLNRAASPTVPDHEVYYNLVCGSYSIYSMYFCIKVKTIYLILIFPLQDEFNIVFDNDPNLHIKYNNYLTLIEKVIRNGLLNAIYCRCVIYFNL